MVSNHYFFRGVTLDWCQPENEQGAILRLVQLGFKGGSNAYDRKLSKNVQKEGPIGMLAYSGGESGSLVQK